MQHLVRYLPEAAQDVKAVIDDLWSLHSGLVPRFRNQLAEVINGILKPSILELDLFLRYLRMPHKSLLPMTSVTQEALNQLLALPVRERLEIIEKLVSSVKEESAPATASAPKPPDLSPYFGALKGVFGDGLEYQKRLRDEWE